MEQLDNLDSGEELHFSWWLEEAKKHNLILNYKREPKVYNLSDSVSVCYTKMLKTKSVISNKDILKGHIYTPDFGIIWNWDIVKNMDFLVDIIESINNPKAIFLANANTETKSIKSIVEVKPIFDQHNMTRLFILNQKWVYQLYKEYVNLIIPEQLFKLTFTPKRYLSTDKTLQKRKLKYTPILIEDFIKNNINQMNIF